MLDLVIVQSDGAITRLSDKDQGTGWEQAELARGADASNLRLVDLDNNGGLDLLSGSKYWLSDEAGKFVAGKDLRERVYDVADMDGDGRLDLLGQDYEGWPVQAINHGAKNYHWQVVRPRAVQATGDQRINSFGVGGEMEIRSGLLVQKQPITGPVLHFGLGEQTSADVIRVTLPTTVVPTLKLKRINQWSLSNA